VFIKNIIFMQKKTNLGSVEPPVHVNLVVVSNLRVVGGDLVVV
jgi:hypothetical protein